MKEKGSMIFAMASLLTLLGAPTVSAETIRLQADIPFAFVVGNKMLPAGTYIVSQPHEAHSVMLIRDRNAGRDPAIIRTNGLEKPGRSEETKLIFTRYGEKFFLHQMWTRGRAD